MGKRGNRVLWRSVPKLSHTTNGGTAAGGPKEGRALRTETTGHNPRDFGIGKRLCNLPALREVGLQANRPYGRNYQPCLPARRRRAEATQRPAVAREQWAAALGFTDPTVQAFLTVLLVFRFLAEGFAAPAPRRPSSPRDAEKGQRTDDLTVDGIPRAGT